MTADRRHDDQRGPRAGKPAAGRGGDVPRMQMQNVPITEAGDEKLPTGPTGEDEDQP
jgi:hypothetical protein